MKFPCGGHCRFSAVISSCYWGNINYYLHSLFLHILRYYKEKQDLTDTQLSTCILSDL